MIKKILKRKFPKLFHLKHLLIDQIDRNQLPFTTPWGFKLAGHPEMGKGKFEVEETKLIRELLNDVDILVNVGANIGYYCCHALSLGKPVIAVEPIERNLYYLLGNIQSNGWSEMAEIFPVAVGAKPNIQNIYGGDTAASLIKGWAKIPDYYVTSISILTLDRILGNKLLKKRALIVVDIEGSEYDMLKGATLTLNNTPRPIWMLEISSREHQPKGITLNPNFKQTFDIFFERGYQCFTADNRLMKVDYQYLNKIVNNDDQCTTNFIFR